MSELEKVIGSILASYETGPRSMNHIGGYELPQQSEVAKCIETRAPCFCRGSWAPP